MRRDIKVHLFRVFRIKYDRLKSLSDSDNLDDALEISAILRHFLIDGNCLSDDVLREIGTPLRFPFPEHEDLEDIEIFSINDISTFSSHKHYNRNDFIDLKCMEVEGSEYTVYDLIDKISNTGGGVHHDVENDKDARKVNLLLNSNEYSNLCLEVLKSISKLTLKGLSNARNAVDREFSFLEQRKRKKQPDILIPKDSDSISLLHFDRKNAAEAYCFLDISSGATVLFSFIPAPHGKGEGAILSIGSRKLGNFISFRIDDSRNICFEVYESGSKYESEIIEYRSGICNVLFLSINDDEKSLVFDIAVYSKKLHQESITVDLDWKELEGKSIIGQDIRSANGAVFQTTLNYVIWNKSYDIDDFVDMLKNTNLRTVLRQDWMTEEDIQQKVPFIRAYDQS